ncbi:MAG: hypothetical protein H7301_03905 [Cryobacterium sp.]|nr:hypothetical protein [Oligoflexia bacterium]
MSPGVFPSIGDIDRSSLRMLAVSPYPPIPLGQIYRKFGQKGPNSHFTYLSQTVQSLSTDKLNPAHVLTDVFGALTYEGKDFSKVLFKYGQLMNHGGRIFFNIPIKNFSIVNAAGKELSAIAYFSNIAGLDLIRSEWSTVGSGAQLIIELQRTEEPLQVPELKLIEQKSFSSDITPFRRYLLESGPPLPIETKLTAAQLLEMVNEKKDFLTGFASWQRLGKELSEPAKLETLNHASVVWSPYQIHSNFKKMLRDFLIDSSPEVKLQTLNFLNKKGNFWVPSMASELEKIITDAQTSNPARVKALLLWTREVKTVIPLPASETLDLIRHYLTAKWVSEPILVTALIDQTLRENPNLIQSEAYWELRLSCFRFSEEFDKLTRLAETFDFSEIENVSLRKKTIQRFRSGFNSFLARARSKDILVNGFVTAAERSHYEMSIKRIEQRLKSL